MTTTRSQAAAARWANMTADERAEHSARATRGRKFGAMVRHIDRVRDDLTTEQLQDLALYLAPWLRPE